MKKLQSEKAIEFAKKMKRFFENPNISQEDKDEIYKDFVDKYHSWKKEKEQG